MVLKIGPDQPVGPVQPPTGSIFGPIHYNEPPNHWTGCEPPKSVVELLDRTNQTVLDELNGTMVGLFPHVFFFAKPTPYNPHLLAHLTSCHLMG